MNFSSLQHYVNLPFIEEGKKEMKRRWMEEAVRIKVSPAF